MADQSELYTLAEEIPDLDRPVLVYHLDGFMDAGRAGQLAIQHLRTLNARRIATFDVDALIDYRSRRPPMTFDTDRWVGYEAPELAVYACEDGVGVPFLVMTGPEPDRAWERFAGAVISLGERLDVQLAIGVHGIPMAVPHTRETGVTPHGNRPDLLGEHPAWINRAEVPGSAAALLEYRMAEAGRDAIGFAAHVPHYLAQSGYPTAAIALLNGITSATGLMFPTADLEEAAAEAREQIDREVAASEDVAEAVRNLEVQYDTIVEAGRNSLPLAGSPVPMPDGEQIAAEFERFLAEQNDQ